MKIIFNKPYISGNEYKYVKQAIDSGHISGNGNFSKKVENFFNIKFRYKR